MRFYSPCFTLEEGRCGTHTRKLLQDTPTHKLIHENEMFISQLLVKILQQKHSYPNFR